MSLTVSSQSTPEVYDTNSNSDTFDQGMIGQEPIEDQSTDQDTTGSNPDDSSMDTPDQTGEDMNSEEISGDMTGSNSGNSAGGDTDTFDQQILDLVNQERAKVGADPLQINEQLDQAADLHTQDQASMDNMTHTGSDGSQMPDRIQDVGYDYSTIGENVAFGYPDAQAVMDGWMNSTGHRENILNPEFEELGVGYSIGSDGNAYWTQNFGAEMN